MSLDYVRKIVSGKKARFQDEETAVDLDLVYVTDRIIIMGYPAVGVSALYRNRRRDVLKFINSRHGDKWWIWNLCPLYENAYSPESMSNRVSRYPFPDHHPPPLPLLPLAVREMTAWLEGDKERVAIIHCKAGKGRSGTLLCSYLLSLSELPPPPQLDRSYTRKELIKRMQESSTEKNVNPEEGADRQGWVVVGTGHEFEGVQVSPPTPTTSVDLGAPVGASGSDTPAQSETLQVERPHGLGRTVSITSSTTTVSRPSPPPSINIDVSSDPPFEAIAVGDEADYDQQGQQDRRDGRVDEVFKLHSSRRMKPSSAGRGVSIPSQRRWCRYIHLLFTHGAPPIYTQSSPSRIRVVSVTLLLHPPTGWKKPLASLVVGGSGGSGLGKAWASVARYDDKYVEELKRRGGEGEGVSGAVTWGGVGGDGHFDTEKMFKSCGKLEAADLDEATRKTLGPDHEEFNVHHLVPKHVNGGDGSLVLDTAREFRLKLHLASMPLGWLWMIPAFHIPSTPEGQGSTKRFHTMTFPKSQVDFTLGPGAAVHKVIVRLEDVAEGQGGSSPAPLYTDDQEKKEGLNDEKAEKLMGDSEK